MAAMAASRRGQHRAHPLEGCAQRGGQLRGRAGQRLAQRAIGTAQRAAQLTQRYRIHPPDGPGQQSLGGIVVESVLGGGQYGQQCAGAGLGADGSALGRLIDRYPGHGQ